MFLKYFLLFFLPVVAKCEIELYREFSSNGKSLSECVLSLIKNNIAGDDLISFYLRTNGNSSRRMAYILKEVNKLSYPLVIRSEDHPASLTRYSNHADKKPQCYIIQCKYVRDLDTSLDILRSYKLWDPLVKFVVIATTEESKHNHSDIIEVINITKSFDLQNVVLVEVKRKNREVHNFITYGIFDVDTYKVVDHCVDGKMRKNVELFPPKVPKNLRGVPVKIRTQVNPPFVMRPEFSSDYSYTVKEGLEIILMNMLGELMNFTPTYILADEYNRKDMPVLDFFTGEVSEDGENGTGLFEPLVNSEVDLVMSAMKLTENRISALDRLVDFYNDGFVFCGPESKKLHTWQQMSNILGPYMFTVLVGLYLLVVLVLTLAEYQYFNKLNLTNTSRNAWMYCFSVLMSTAFYKSPRGGTVRLIAAIWMIFSLIFSATYQSYLYRALSQHDHRPRFRNVFEAIDRGYNIYLVTTTDSLYRNSADEHDRYIASKAHLCPNDQLGKCFMQLLYSDDSIMSLPKYFSSLVKKSLVYTKGKSSIFCLSNNIEMWTTHVFMRKGYWLRPKMDFYLSQLKEIGFQELWTRTVMEKFNKVDKDVECREHHRAEDDAQNRKKHSHSVDVVFTLEQFIACFMILAGGYVLAGVVFLIELYIINRQKRKQKTATRYLFLK